MTTNDNIAILTGALTAFNENDIDGLAQFLDPDVKYIVRGNASVSGTYDGREGFADALRRIKNLTDGTMATTPEVMLSDGDVLMAYTRVTGSRSDGRTYDHHQAYLYRFRDGKLIEGQTIPVDQQAFAEFFA